MIISFLALWMTTLVFFIIGIFALWVSYTQLMYDIKHRRPFVTQVTLLVWLAAVFYTGRRALLYVYDGGFSYPVLCFIGSIILAFVYCFLMDVKGRLDRRFIASLEKTFPAHVNSYYA